MKVWGLYFPSAGRCLYFQIVQTAFLNNIMSCAENSSYTLQSCVAAPYSTQSVRRMIQERGIGPGPEVTVGQEVPAVGVPQEAWQVHEQSRQSQPDQQSPSDSRLQHESNCRQGQQTQKGQDVSEQSRAPTVAARPIPPRRDQDHVKNRGKPGEGNPARRPRSEMGARPQSRPGDHGNDRQNGPGLIDKKPSPRG